MTCVQIEEKTKVYNNICFDNLNDITNNIKQFSENNTVITTESGITMRGYSTKSVYDQIEDDELSYSLVYLGECEDKLREYYKLPKGVDIFIFGIDSPNKNKSYVTTVYNYEVYLSNGTQLDYLNVCDNTKISISSAILDTDLIKFDQAFYFSDLGYDIYNENNSFFLDVCSHASINGNDITLADRKRDFSTSNISLCNESCYYSNVNFTTKRFTCECDAVYNFSSNKNDNIDGETKDTSYKYLDYFLSFINYKIVICYKLFLNISSYYYNAGFYISVGTTVLCLCAMVVFLRWGIKDLNNRIINSIPSKEKIMEMIKKKGKKRKRRMSKRSTKININNIDNNNNNPPKVKKGKRKTIKRASIHKRKTIKRLQSHNKKYK